jgi:hypothetical protein
MAEVMLCETLSLISYSYSRDSAHQVSQKAMRIPASSLLKGNAE